MPQALRKIFQRKREERGESGRTLELRLSGLTVAVLLLLFVAVLCWSFFMGFMVGRGQSPAHHVEELTGILPVPEDGPLPEIQDGQGEMAGREPHPVDTPLPSSDVLNDVQGDTPAARPPADRANGQTAPPQPAGQDLPFARPSGESLAAWGITPAANLPQGQAQGQKPGQGQAQESSRNTSAQKRLPQSDPAGMEQEARFDYIFQTAAFKSQNEAEALRQRLEEAGMRCRIQSSGKFWLVMVHLRGSQREADNLVEDLRRMKLGKPLQRSRQAVSPRKATTTR
ncbi:MAG: SPOR domain-containing protein [Desulfovibrio sp.]|nr:SPOR domain-containing protein [Desulfovibrio sp.]